MPAPAPSYHDININNLMDAVPPVALEKSVVTEELGELKGTTSTGVNASYGFGTVGLQYGISFDDKGNTQKFVTIEGSFGGGASLFRGMTLGVFDVNMGAYETDIYNLTPGNTVRSAAGNAAGVSFDLGNGSIEYGVAFGLNKDRVIEISYEYVTKVINAVPSFGGGVGYSRTFLLGKPEYKKTEIYEFNEPSK